MDNSRLIDIILDNIDYAEYKLKNDEKKWIYNFINESRDTFIELDTDLQTITEDRYIKIDDIPTIIKIVADTYYFGAIKNANIFNSSHLCTIIKYTMLVILDSELLVLNRNISKERLNNIIDSSLALLNMNLTNIDGENDSHCNCFYSYSLFNFVSIRNLLRK